MNGAFCGQGRYPQPQAQGLSRMVGKHGITVNCIPPGRILSEQILRNYTPEYRQWQSDNEIPVGRYGETQRCQPASELPGLAAGRLHHRRSDPCRSRSCGGISSDWRSICEAYARGGAGQLNSPGGSRAVGKVRVQPLVVGPQVHQDPERSHRPRRQGRLHGDGPRICDAAIVPSGLAARPVPIKPPTLCARHARSCRSFFFSEDSGRSARELCSQALEI